MLELLRLSRKRGTKPSQPWLCTSERTGGLFPDASSHLYRKARPAVEMHKIDRALSLGCFEKHPEMTQKIISWSVDLSA